MVLFIGFVIIFFGINAGMAMVSADTMRLRASHAFQDAPIHQDMKEDFKGNISIKFLLNIISKMAVVVKLFIQY